MRIKLISGGTGATTQVVNAATGEPIEGIYRAHIVIKANDEVFVALTFRNVPLEIEAELAKAVSIENEDYTDLTGDK